MFQDAVKSLGWELSSPKAYKKAWRGEASCVQVRGSPVVHRESQGVGFPSSSATETCVTLASHSVSWSVYCYSCEKHLYKFPGCQNTTSWDLKMPGMHSLIVLGARSPRSRCQQGCAPADSSGEELSLLILLGNFGRCQLSLACGHFIQSLPPSGIWRSILFLCLIRDN